MIDFTSKKAARDREDAENRELLQQFKAATKHLPSHLMTNLASALMSGDDVALAQAQKAIEAALKA